MKKLVFCHGFPYHKSILLPLALSFEAVYGSSSHKESILANFMQHSLTLSEIKQRISDKQQVTVKDNLSTETNIENNKKQLLSKNSSKKKKSTLVKPSLQKEDNFVFTPEIENQLEIINLDLGYFGDRFTVNESELEGAIAIGHGIGFNKLLDMNVSWRGIVGISTLFKFVYNEESKRKIENLENSLNHDVELALKSMINRLSNNEVAIPLPYPKIDLKLIHQDIEYLKNTNSEKLLQKKNIPALFLHAGKDNWYDVLESKKQFKNYNLIINENASHILGYLKATWCRDNIIKFIDNL